MASQEERDRIIAEYLASVQNEDDDEDDETEFQPEIDDEEEEEEEEDLQFSDYDDTNIWMGELSYNNTQKLVYKGEKSNGDLFNFFSSKPLYWNSKYPTRYEKPIDGNEEKVSDPRMRTIVLEDKNSQKIQFTITKARASSSFADQGIKKVGKNIEKNHDEIEDKSTGAKSTVDNNNNEVHKKMASSSKNKLKLSPSHFETVSYSFFGQGDGYELYGEIKNKNIINNRTDLTEKEKNENETIIPLECRHKSLRHKKVVSVAAAATSREFDSDGDDDSVSQEKVDYNELIALHEDAGLPVQELRKRYRNGNVEPNSSNNNKRPKSHEDDDDDEIDGF